MLGGEGELGEHVVRAVIHQPGEFGPTRSELVGHLPPGLPRGRLIGLPERLAQGRGHHRVLAFGDVG